MPKLDYFMLTRSVPSTWQKCHVEEITTYLYSRGYSFGLLKCPNSSKYLLSIDEYSIFFPDSKSLCLFLIDIYFNEKEEEERAFLLERAERVRKNIKLKERIKDNETIYFKKV